MFFNLGEECLNGRFSSCFSMIQPTLRRICIAISVLVLCGPGGVYAQSLSATPSADAAYVGNGADLPESLRDATIELDRLSADVERNGDTRSRALLAWRNPVVSFPEGSADLAALTKAGVPDDAVTLMLFSTGCDAFGVGCEALPFATRWTEVDADNAAAWLHLWNVDTRLGDAAGSDAALAQAVAAPNWRDYTIELSSAFVNTASASPDVLVRLVARLQSAPRVVGVVSVLYREALAMCRLPSKKDQCAALTDRIAAQPVSLLQATVAASLSAHFGAPPEVVQQRRERVEAWQWAVAQNQPRGLLSSDPRSNAAEVITYIDNLNQQGEAAAAKRVLLAKHLTESQAATLYRAARAQPKAPTGSIQDQSGARLHMPAH